MNHIKNFYIGQPQQVYYVYYLQYRPQLFTEGKANDDERLINKHSK